MDTIGTTVIVDVQLGTADAKAKAVEITNQIITLKDKQDLLRASGQQLSVGYAQLTQQISQLTQQQKAYISLAQNETTSNNARGAQLKLITQQLNTMSDAQRTASNTGKLLTGQAAKLKEELNNAGKSIGNFTGDVGKYTDGINKSNVGQQKFSQGITQLVAQNVPYGNSLINLVKGTNSLGGAFEGASIGAAGLVAVGAGLVAVTAAIVTHFAELTPNANALAQSFAGIKGYWRGFLDSIAESGFDKLGTDMVKTAQEARALEKAFQDLGRAFDVLSVKNSQYDTQLTDLQLKLRRAVIDRDEPLAGQLTNKIVAQSESRYSQNKDYLLNLYEASVGKATNTPRFSQDDINSLLAVGKSGIPDFRNIQTAANLDKNKGFVDKEDLQTLTDIANQLQANEKIREQSEEMAENRYERLKMSEERREQARKNGLQQIEKDRIDSAARIAEATMTIRQTEYEKINADIEKRKLLYEKWGADSTNLEQERLSRIATLDEKFRKEDLVAIAKNFEDIAKLRSKSQSYQDVLNDTLAGGNANFRLNEQATATFATNIANGTGKLPFTTKDAEIFSNMAAELQKLQKEADDIQARIDKGEKDLKFKNPDGSMSEKGTLSTQLDQLNKKIGLTQDKGIKDFNEQRVKETAEANAQVEKLATDQIKIENDLLTQQEEIYARRERLNERLAGSYESLAGSIAEMAGKNSVVGKAAFTLEKSFAIAKIIINAELQKSEIATAAAKSAAFYAGFGPVGDAIAAGYLIAAIAEEAAITTEEVEQVATIAAQAIITDVTGHAKGGYISGPGTGTSDSIPARLSNGEFVMTEKATRMYGPLLADMNMSAGGEGFASGGLAGSYVPNLSQQIDSNNAISRAMVSSIKGMKLAVSVEDINYGLQQAEVLQTNGDF